MKLADLQNATYIALETYKKNGQGVITPVWQTPVDGNLYVLTEANSWKVKRLRRNNRLRVCQSDYRGTPQSDWVEAQARLLTDPETHKAQKQRVTAKYGWQHRLFLLADIFRRPAYVVIEISPAEK